MKGFERKSEAKAKAEEEDDDVDDDNERVMSYLYPPHDVT